MSRPLKNVEKEDPQLVSLAALAKVEELHATIAEIRARRAEAYARVAKAEAEIAAANASSRSG